MKKTFGWVAIVGLALTAGACRQPQAQTVRNERVQPTFDKDTGRLTRLEADSNGDGEVDTWGYMDGMRVVRVEVDENGDGTVDRWEFHKQGLAGQRVQGSVDKTIERIDRATRFDGKVSRWEYFDNGSL